MKKLFKLSYGLKPLVAGQNFITNSEHYIYECPKTGIRYTRPEPDIDQINRCYKKSEGNVWPEDVYDTYRRGYSQIVSSIEKYTSRNKKNICDIGCYTGGFLNTFNTRWGKYGIEPSIIAAEAAGLNDIEIIGEKWEDVLNKNQKFDCISSLSVIEHICEQDLFVDKIRQSLNPNGLLFIETGDYLSLWARFMRRRWYYYNLPEHVAFHSRRTLPELLEKHGFSVLELSINKYHKRPKGFIQWGSHLKCLGIAFGKKINIFQKNSDPYRAFLLDHLRIIAKIKR